MPRAIDLMHLGRDRVIGAYVVDGVVIDPGPTTGLEALLGGLGGEPPRALLLTHIHLDHAGATGVLVRRFPGLPVYVHERGAAHLVDPSKLLRSAARLYGDDMYRLWGEVAPVPEANVRALEGGETVEGFRVAYTPGHASHHVSFLHESTGAAFVGDVAGVRIPPAAFTLAPTPPPDIDIALWHDSLDTVAGWSPASLCLTHFGEIRDVEEQLEAVRAGLALGEARAREGDFGRFAAALDDDLAAAGVDPATAETYRQAAPPEQLFLGLERYLSKQSVKSG